MTSLTTPCRHARSGSPRPPGVRVTDRCNLRCRYCMPREIFGPGFVFLPSRRICCAFEEISLRVGRVRPRRRHQRSAERRRTPLLACRTSRLLSRWLPRCPSIDDIALTTNGSLLSLSTPMTTAGPPGSPRVTVSLDRFDAETPSVADAEVTARVGASTASQQRRPRVSPAVEAERGGSGAVGNDDAD